MRSARFAAILWCASILIACGGAGDAIKFSAPPKFGQPKNMLGMMQIWTTPNQKEVLMLMKLPVVANAQNAIQSSNLKDAIIEKQQQIKICGNQSARLITMSKPQQHQQIDAVMSPVAGSTYMAMYGYPAGSKPDPQAEAAIRDLCVK